MTHLSVEVSQLLPTNVCTCVVTELDASFSVSLDNIGFDLWPALKTLANNTIVGRGLDVILLYRWLARGVWIVAEDQDTVICALLNCILEDD